MFSKTIKHINKLKNIRKIHDNLDKTNEINNKLIKLNDKIDKIERMVSFSFLYTIIYVSISSYIVIKTCKKWARFIYNILYISFNFFIKTLQTFIKKMIQKKNKCFFPNI